MRSLKICRLMPSVFAKLASKIFAIFGFIEFFAGLFFPSLSEYGIGGNYLIIVCAPIIILYDYKTKYELHIRPCKNRDSGKCVMNSVSIFLNFFIIIFGIAIAGTIIDIIDKKIKAFVEFIIDNIKDIIEVLKELNVVG